MNDELKQVREAIRGAKHIAVLTGAGISAESGIPTFRDALTGLWAKYNPAELATPEAFACDPARVAQLYDERRLKAANCRPNQGHYALARLEQLAREKNASFSLLTQNVDRLHQTAGSINVIELHGSVWEWRCVSCGTRSEERGPAFPSYPPRCQCGGLRRPGVVWFGEELNVDVLAAAQQAVATCDFFISVGTGSVVYPAAGLIEQAIGRGIETLEVNPQTTPFSDRFHWSIRRQSGEALSQIAQAVLEKA